jgi:putative transposase
MEAQSLIRQHLEAHPDVLRGLLQGAAETLMHAEADALWGAGHGERSPERVNSRNGYRPRDWDTRAGTVKLAIPRLRQGSYVPDWLREPSGRWCRRSPRPTWPG